MRAASRLWGIPFALALLVACPAGDESPAPARSSAPQPVALPVPLPQPEVREFDQPEQLSKPAPSTHAVELPDVTLIDQAGQPVRLRTLLEGKIAVIQTIFTSCTTICPPMGINFGKLQTLVADQPDVVLISISIDPITDIPERLATWARTFDAGPNWTQLTGSSEDIRSTLAALRVFTAEKSDHSSVVVIGHRDSGTWTRVDGLSEPQTLVDAIAAVRAKVPAATPPEPARPANEVALDYFTDVELVDQHGKPHRLYSDLLQGKVVVIHSFFTTCQGICPPMTQRIADLYELLHDQAGDRLLFLSLTVDPITDQTPQLAAYADKYHAGPGWLFLGGDKPNVDLALYKLGFAVEDREAHSNLVVVGNEATGLWKKAFSMAEPEQLLAVVRSVLDDPAG